MNWIKQLLSRHRPYSDLSEEIQEHLAEKIDELMAGGMSRGDATHAARREFGNVVLIEERGREVWRWPFIENFLMDVRYGARQLRRSPGLTAVVVLSLALGIGANTAVFSLIDAVMLKGLPVQEPERLVLLSWTSQGWPAVIRRLGAGGLTQEGDRNTGAAFSHPIFADIQSHNAVFSGVLGFTDPERVTVNAGAEAALAEGQFVSGTYFLTLGVRPILGRAIEPADDTAGASGAAVISYNYWTRRFGRDPSAIGKAIGVNGVPFTVVGVAPPEFFGVQPGAAIDLWIPLHSEPQVDARWADPKEGSKFAAVSDWWIEIIARLKPGVSVPQGQAAVDVIVRQNVLALGPQKKRFEGISLDPPRVRLAPASKGLDNLRQEFSRPLFILMGIVGLVLLIACANVANLLLARATTRQKEMAVRLALGAGRTRLIRQLLTESVLLASAGGALGVLLAYWASSILLAFMSSGRDPVTLHVTPDLRVLTFTAGVSVLTGILFGLAPALRGTRLSLTPALKEGAGGAHRHGRRLRLGLGKALVAAQVAISLLLLMGAALFVRTLVNLQTQSLGFDRRNLLLFRLDPVQAGYPADQLPSFYQELQRRLEGLPGVRSASVSQNTLINGGAWIDGIVIEGYTPKPADGSDGQVTVWLNPVGPGFFRTMGIPLLLGRPIDERDARSAPKVTVINQALARQCFAGSSPVGRRLGGFGGSKPGDFQIVGVVGDTKYGGLRDKAPPTVYIAYAQNPDPGPTSVELRTAGDPKHWMSTVRGAVQSLDRNLPLFDFKTQAEQIEQATFQERLFARLSSFFGLLALTLACVGLCGMMSYAVARRTNEIGIRMALGAERAKIVRMVLSESMALAGLGMIVGVPAALAASRLLVSALYGVKPTDPLTIAVATAALAVVVLLAGYLPARRASRVDPMVALRYE